MTYVLVDLLIILQTMTCEDLQHQLANQDACCLSAASLHVIRITTDGRVAYASSAAAALFRSQQQEKLEGACFVDTWVAEEDQTTVRLELAETLQGAGTSGKLAKATLLLPGGPWNTLLYIAATCKEKDAVDGVLIVVQDFTKLASFVSSVNSEASQAELKRTREEAAMAHRKADMMWQEAQQARLQAVQLQTQLSELRKKLEDIPEKNLLSPTLSAGGIPSAKVKEKVMHDLRSPLHGIIGLANTLCEQSSFQKPLKMISSSAARALDNVTKMVEYFNLAEDPSDRLDEEKKPYDIAILAAEVLESCGRAVDKRGDPIQKKGVELVKDIDSSVVPISWDRHSVNQMLYHLLSNAFKFTAKGQVKLRITSDDEGVNITVQDSGIGVASENVSRIFEAFQQEDISLSRKYEGLGLGLAIVRIIVQKCLGTLKLDSEQGKGSTFNVWLPTKASAVPRSGLAPQASSVGSHTLGVHPQAGLACTATLLPAPSTAAVPMCTNDAPVGHAAHTTGLTISPPMSRAPSKTSTRESLPEISQLPHPCLQASPSGTAQQVRRYTVMSVDDDPVNQEVMRQTLEPYGFKIIVCMSGFECLNLMQQEPMIMPDIILLDLGMPGIDGFDVLKAQRKKYGAEVLPIVMVSAEEQVRSVVQGFELGANDWIRKPFEKSEFVARVKAHLRLKDSLHRCCSNLNTIEEVAMCSGLLPEVVCAR